MDNLRKIEFVLIMILFILNLLFFVSYRGEITANVISNKEGIHISPSNFLSEDDIRIYDDRIIIHMQNASVSRYSMSESMMPFLDENTNGIVVVPESSDQINVGDVITFEKDEKFIVHRVIEKGIDEDGVYFITKGDNANLSDGKIRFPKIKSVLVIIIY